MIGAASTGRAALDVDTRPLGLLPQEKAEPGRVSQYADGRSQALPGAGSAPMRLRLVHGDIEPHRRVNCAAHEERPGSVEPQFDALAHGLLSESKANPGKST